MRGRLTSDTRVLPCGEKQAWLHSLKGQSTQLLVLLGLAFIFTEENMNCSNSNQKLCTPKSMACTQKENYLWKCGITSTHCPAHCYFNSFATFRSVRPSSVTISI